MERIILASGSPARKYLLESAGVLFDVVPSDIDEAGHPERRPSERASVLARLKAEKCHADYPGTWIISGDSYVIAHDGSLLEKPIDADDARRMLRLQRGTLSYNQAALCLIAPDGSVQEGSVRAGVLMRDYTDDEIEWWIRGGLWEGKSGAFQIMGKGQILIEKIDGSYNSVMGLPIPLLAELFAKAGRPLHTFIQP